MPTHLGEVDALHALVETTVETFGEIDIVAQPLAAREPQAVAR